jgi:hypothetical protein
MNRFVRTVLPLLLIASLATACAVRLGGPSPQNYTAVALQVGGGVTAAETGQRLRNARTEVALISAERDSAWFAGVAEAAGLQLSGPGRINGRGFSFLSRLELLGDTTLTLEVPGGGSVHMHDALYRVDRDRYLDLMLVRFDAPDLRAAVRALLLYAATDVMPNAAVLLHRCGDARAGRQRRHPHATVLSAGHGVQERACRSGPDRQYPVALRPHRPHYVPHRKAPARHADRYRSRSNRATVTKKGGAPQPGRPCVSPPSPSPPL